MPRRPPPPKPVPEPLLPHGAEGPSGRDEQQPEGKVQQQAPRRSKRDDRTFVKLPPTNVHGRLVTGTWPQFELRSTSETAFPTMFNPADSKFWQGLSDEQQLEVTRMQAAAMERVGFEPGTRKYFIDAEEDTTDLYTVLGQEKPAAVERNNELEGGGKWIGGGVLIGGGLAGLALAISPLITPEAGLDGLLTWGGAAGIILGGILAAIKVEPRKRK